MAVKITKLEKQLLRDIALTCHSSDGHGFTMWVGVGYETMPMRQARALITTLKEKGVIWHEPADPRAGFDNACIGPTKDFVTGDNYKPTKHYYNDWPSCPFTDGVHGFKYQNLEWD